MPPNRRFRGLGLIVLLTLFIIFYLSSGPKSTQNSRFYTRTVDALKHRQEAGARQHVIEKEKQRLARVEQLQKEHDVAISALKPGALATETPKPVAGRKIIPGERIVQTRPAHDDNDGVAKVGNVESKPSGPAKKGSVETEEDHRVEEELNDILKKSPIIIFSKSYCRFSKKAKHVLLDLYNITPAPYVVELDKHELGSSLQSALGKSTGRRTVPNVLINGKSIGGGDDVEALHTSDRLISTVSSMGGKRMRAEVKA
ncbi:glutaredoxin [Piedraia hortae CBS 480.64]|uniref:Glutaredoxin n=1 Tax=Piedraia hortae CBS 480.64 TaxID=1314780 RepID=A0A6A7C591_9PEZI|nr:glutaredoxin [Piedraia hortae CBS 480.64]